MSCCRLLCSLKDVWDAQSFCFCHFQVLEGDISLRTGGCLVLRYRLKYRLDTGGKLQIPLKSLLTKALCIE